MKALIIVDIQKDFLPGGALAVPGGDEIVAVANDLISQGGYNRIVATQDWHPANHVSFAENHKGREVGDVIELNGFPQNLWPVHCVQTTNGAEFGPGLNTEAFDAVFQKGTDSEVDSYSGFFDNRKGHSTGLADYLRKEGIEAVDVIGLALDYCVKFTALDAAAEGFRTRVIESGCRAVNIRPRDGEGALEEMRQGGITIR